MAQWVRALLQRHEDPSSDPQHSYKVRNGCDNLSAGGGAGASRDRRVYGICCLLVSLAEIWGTPRSVRDPVPGNKVRHNRAGNPSPFSGLHMHLLTAIYKYIYIYQTHHSIYIHISNTP